MPRTSDQRPLDPEHADGDLRRGPTRQGTRVAFGALDRPIALFRVEVEIECVPPGPARERTLRRDLRPICAVDLRVTDVGVTFAVPCTAVEPDVAAWRVHYAVFGACGRWPVRVSVFAEAQLAPQLVLTSDRLRACL